MAMLDVTNLSISFGGVRAVDELTMQIEEGGLVGLIGPNGAGKTTPCKIPSSRSSITTARPPTWAHPSQVPERP